MTGRFVLGAVLAVFATAADSLGQTTVPYAGTVHDVEGVPLPDGESPMVFSLWTESEGGDLLWQEDHEVVPVQGLFYRVQLGGMVPFGRLDLGAGLWLEVAVGSDPAGPRTEFADSGDRTIVLGSEGIRFGDDGEMAIARGSHGLIIDSMKFPGRIALQTAPLGGPVHIPVGTDAEFEPFYGGYLVIGGFNLNLVLDNNEIMARAFGRSSPLYLQHDGGDVYINGNLVETSDLRRKREIRELSQGLDALLRLRPVSFASVDRPEERRFGLIAQEVRRVVGEVVYEDEDGMLGIAYQSLVPLLIRAVQDQQSEIERLRADLEALRLQRREAETPS